MGGPILVGRDLGVGFTTASTVHGIGSSDKGREAHEGDDRLPDGNHAG
eukprot:CAMPEP_0174746202 /NCGR_PEP_ID=MMETSP1094-20130205/88548_1 /TAXON_ID=156173 /ORGANISM="Chrysochromulina brevifilum, Strain UTEX LB 985" /LENGTH=47 /DNA_ID= /DNA_START= /DNA_END= /DNA_ORIENTATION=